MKIDQLTTERLYLRQWQQSDFPALASFFASAENARFVGGAKSPEEAWRVMATYIGHHQPYGYSYMAVVDKAANQLQGTVGLLN
ncbi:MAG: GNAT family N-acetyltransferase [Bacteroidota bacterium]